MRVTRFFFMLGLGFLTLPCAGLAQDKAAEKDPVQQTAPENPYQDQIRVEALKLSRSLDEPQLRALTQLRTGFGMIRAVRLVRTEVGEAVKLCAEANPKISKEIAARHESWDKAVAPVLEAKEKSMGEAIESGVFAQPKSISTYLDLIDKSAAFADGQLEKKMVTTPDACQSLADSMDDTQKKLTQLLAAIEWPQKEGETAPAENNNPVKATAPATR